MDSLIGLLILFAIFTRLNKKKKQKEAARKAQMQAQAFAEAAAVQLEKPTPAKTSAPVKKAVPEKKPAQQKIPFSKEEWAEFLATENIQQKKPRPAELAEGDGCSPTTSNEGRLSRRQLIPEGISPALRSTQGESEEEHRRHVERIVREEKKQQMETNAQRELRSVNRRKLREAVIMSEILSKPVALRPRGQR